MNFVQLRNGLEFDNYFIKTNKIGYIFLLQCSTVIRYVQFHLTFEGDACINKFHLKGFLIYLFKKATPQFHIDGI